MYRHAETVFLSYCNISLSVQPSVRRNAFGIVAHQPFGVNTVFLCDVPDRLALVGVIEPEPAADRLIRIAKLHCGKHRNMPVFVTAQPYKRHRTYVQRVAVKLRL